MEKLLIGRGIGFNRKKGETFQSDATVEKVFIIENSGNQHNFKQLFKYDGPEFVDFCEELILYISQSANGELNENIHISLIDHIACTLRRIRLNEQIVNPFLDEIETLYEKEFLLAQQVCDRISKKYLVKIPEGEVGFIALHIHSALYNGKVKDVLRVNRICNEVVQLIEDELKAPVDKKSMECVRFLLHLRYAIERTVQKKTVENELADIIINSYPTSYGISLKIKEILKEELGAEDISKEELAFLTMHLEQLKRKMEKTHP